jgi:hypothetical protein
MRHWRREAGGGSGGGRGREGPLDGKRMAKRRSPQSSQTFSRELDTSMRQPLTEDPITSQSGALGVRVVADIDLVARGSAAVISERRADELRHRCAIAHS